MPSNNDFDEILKSKFENFEAPLPTGGWNNIKGKLPKEKKKGFFWMPFVMAASVFITMLSGYFFIKNNDSELNSRTVESTKDSLIEKESKVLSFNDTPNGSNEKSSSNSGTSKDASEVLNNNLNFDKTFKNDLVEVDLSDTKQNDVKPIAPIININQKEKIERNTVGNENSSLDNNFNSTIIVSNSSINNTENIVESSLNNIVGDDLNEVNKELAINLMPFSYSKLSSLTRRDVELNKEVIDNNVTVINLENIDDEKVEKTKKYHLGIITSTLYTTKRINGNENDNVIISKFSELNKIKSTRMGYSLGFIGTYDLFPKVSLIGGFGCTNISDENIYTVVENNNSPIINTSSNNSMSFSTMSKREKTVTTTLHYLELDAGVKHLISKKSIYLKETAGFSKLLTSKGENNFRKQNYNIAFAVGKEYNVGKIKINIEPEITYYIKSYQSEGEIMAKPTTFGINFIAIR